MTTSSVKERKESLGGDGVDDASWANFMDTTAFQTVRSRLQALERGEDKPWLRALRQIRS
jgi:hypothetical protein